MNYRSLLRCLRAARSSNRATLSCLPLLTAAFVPSVVHAQDTPQGTSKGYLRLEVGTADLAYNSLQYPTGSDGTQRSLRPLLHTGDKAFGRVTFEYAINDAQGIRLDYAPLQDSGTGELPGTFTYQGKTFMDSQPTHAAYRFDNYRATYWLRLHNDARFYARAGLTVDVLNAQISLNQAGQSAHFSKTLPVPLLYLALEYRLTPGLKFSAEADGLAISQGHMADLNVRLVHPFTSRVDASLGLRTLEGEAEGGSFRTVE